MLIEFIDSLGIEALVVGILAAGVTITMAFFAAAYTLPEYAENEE